MREAMSLQENPTIYSRPHDTYNNKKCPYPAPKCQFPKKKQLSKLFHALIKTWSAFRNN